MNDQSDEETDDPLRADDRNFYKVEKWTRDGTKVDSLLYAGNSLGRARSVFESADQASAADQTDNPATNTDVRSVATTATQDAMTELSVSRENFT